MEEPTVSAEPLGVGELVLCNAAFGSVDVDGEGDGDGGKEIDGALPERTAGSSSAPSTGATNSGPSTTACLSANFPLISSSVLPYSSFQNRTSLGLINSTPMSGFGLVASSSEGS